VRDPGIWLCGVMCLYPLIFFALPGYLLGRYRVRVRSPIQFSDKQLPSGTKSGPMIRRVSAEEKIGYGSSK